VSILKAKIIHVNAGAGYDIHIAKGVIDSAGELAAAVTRSRRAAIITDSSVAELYGGRVKKSFEAAGFEAPLFAFPAGEASKTHATLLAIYAFLARSEVTRADMIVALGGGVPGDVAGFAAATWQRGLDFMQIPTTLLAQVDSSIGGKTGVDLPEGKNLVGAFWQPRLVVCDPDTLGTLDSENISCGMAEVIKHACIRSRKLFDSLKAHDRIDGNIVETVMANLVIKRDIVERDERERGERMLLNFGHTLGHAIEKLLDFRGISHGGAVAAGMALMARASERNGLTAPGTADALDALLAQYGLSADCGLDIGDIVDAARGDKKRSGSDINLVLLKDIGESFVYRLPVDRLRPFFGV
jgi:3-dehydroquinate synthase